MKEVNLTLETETKIIKPKIEKIVEPGELGLVIDIVVRDKNGKIKRQEIKKSRSFVRQFLELLFVQAGGFSISMPYKMKDTGGDDKRWVYSTRVTFYCDALINENTWGIVVGTGTTAPTIEDYVMETLIAHGTGAGQLQYSATVFGTPASDGATSQFTMTRNFTNGSGGDITIYELGFIGEGRYVDASAKFLLARDISAGGILVENGETLTLNYRVQVVTT